MLPSSVVVLLVEENSRMVVTWVTFDPTNTSEVRYGLSGQGLTLQATGTVTAFVDESLTSEITRYVHRVNMTGLLPLSKYGMCENIKQCDYQRPHLLVET